MQLKISEIFLIKKKTKAIKDRILRDIKNLSELINQLTIANNFIPSIDNG